MDSKHRNDKVKELAKLIKEKEDEWKTETDALQKDLHKPRLRLLQGVVRDTSAHAGREEEF
eukprot:gene7867-6027_t